MTPRSWRLGTTGLALLETLMLVGSTVAGACAADQPARPAVSLDGTWEFRMDPNDEGVAGRWWAPETPYPDRIAVPANWQAQGFGEPWRHLRHDYQGKAWYRRRVAVPGGWAGLASDAMRKGVWLHLGGVSNTAEVYVNGRHVGSAEGFLTPYEFDVTEGVQAGTEAVIACRVDSTGPAPVGMFNFFGRWGGLYRSVRLEARPDPAIDDVFVMPDVRQATARTRVTLRRSAPGPEWEGRVRVSVRPVKGGPASSAEGTLRFAAGQLESDPAMVPVRVRRMHLWSPEDPFLYQVEVAVLAGGALHDVVRDWFGMRQIEASEDGRLLLNGRPYFVRGIGDDCVEVLTGTAAPDKRVYLERIRQCKRYGYNGFRFLAHTPAKEIFEAADEAGFLIMAEGEMYWQLKEAIPILKRQVARIARAYRNHPSWYIWSAGNEFFECQGSSPEPDWMEYIHYAHDTFRRLDSTRLFIASDGADVFPADVITQASRFGAAPALFEQPFHGDVDEVAYFRRALSGEDLRRLAQPAAGYADLVRSLEPSGYWPLDEAAVGTVADASGNGRHGRHEAGAKPEHLGVPGIAAGAGGSRALRTGSGERSVGLQEVAGTTFAAGNDPFSVSLWVRPNGFRVNDWGTPFSYGSARDGAAFLLSLDGQAGDGKLIVGRWMANLPASEGRLAAGEWNHIGVTYDGQVMRLFLNGKPDRATPVRVSAEPVDGRIGNLIQQGAPDMSRYKELPHIWHEFPNTYVGPLPDIAIDRKYTGVFRDDDCVARHRRAIEGYRLTERYPEIRARSIDLFYLYLKGFYESARSSPTLDGYAYWLMTDLPGGVEGDTNTLGLFNTLCEPDKFPDPEPVLRFNRETVLLIDAGPEQRTLGAREPRKVTLSVSHFGRQPVRGGAIRWEVASGDEVLARGVLRRISVDVGEVKAVGTVTLGGYPLAGPRKLTLRVRLESKACRQENEWDFWAFPERKRDFAGAGIANLTGVGALDTRYGASRDAASAKAVLATRLDGAVESALARGARVVLLSESGTLARPLRFTYSPDWIRGVGNVVERHPALGDFPQDGFCAFQLYRLFGESLEAVDLSDKDRAEWGKLTPVVWGLKTDYDPSVGTPWSDPNNRWKIYRAGLVCEGRVGDGRLIICSLRVLDGVRRGFPEAGYLLDCLVDYALSSEPASLPPPMEPGDLQGLLKAG